MGFVQRFKKKFYFVVAGYFRHFANRVLKRWSPRAIAITGSVGKTTMLHLVEQELGGRAHYSHDANSAFGIAFDLVNLRGITGSKLRWLYLFIAVPVKSLFVKHYEEFYVVEIDGERPHETEFLAEWLKPEVTLWVSLGRSHAVQFESQVDSGEFETLDKAITHEFAMLPQYTKKRIYIDADVPLMVKACEKIKQHHHVSAKVIACSKSALKDYKVKPDSADFVIAAEKSGKKTVFQETSFHFAAPIQSDLAIQLVMLRDLCNYLNLKLKTDLSDMPLPPGRNSYFKGKNGLKIIDSSYNAHLISVESVLSMVSEMDAPHKWLVLGDIVDQGAIEHHEHEKLAEIIKNVKPEQVILVGRRTKKYTYPLLEKAKISTFSTLDPHEALDYIEKHTTGQETLVFKGSQYLEWIIEKLLEDPEDAKKLPRRDKGAVNRRKKHGLDS